MKNEILYNKLVRDNILEIIEKTGKKSLSHIAMCVEYKEKLLDKLEEEVKEFLVEKNEEEIADILKVIDHIIDAFNFDKEKISKIKKLKNQKNGKFNKRIILEKVYE